MVSRTTASPRDARSRVRNWCFSAMLQAHPDIKLVYTSNDLAASGAYYVAVGADRVVAHPTTVTGGLGALINHSNLQDASAQLNARAGAVKAGEKTITKYHCSSFRDTGLDADACQFADASGKLPPTMPAPGTGASPAGPVLPVTPPVAGPCACAN